MDVKTREKIERHDGFWKRLTQDRPLLGFTTADRFPYDKMRASQALMQPGQHITPDMVDVEAFAEQTAEQLAFQQESRLPRDFFRSVSPFGGIPWMESILGCGVLAMDRSFAAEPCMQSPGDPAALTLEEDNPWLNKYIEFLAVYERRFGDAHPVTEPLMRGCLDVYGSLIGQQNMVYAFYDEPAVVHAMLDKINRIYVEMVELTLRHSRPFHGGMLHPYGLWAPGTVNQFQEDMCALITPGQMLDFVVPLHNRMCAKFDFNGMHTHPTGYHVYPQQLSVTGLNMVQAQKDEGDPPIFNVIDTLRSVQDAGKCLNYGADLTEEELAALLDRLELRGLMLSLRVNSEDEALAMYDQILEICAKKTEKKR